jgi:ABC-2 type transport system ATP-binding protein
VAEIPVLRARRLGRRYGANWALAHVDLDLAAGELLVLTGANGSGKTTLLRLLCGLIRRTRGELSVLGHDPSSDPIGVRRVTSFVSHRGYLYDELKAREMLELWSGLLGQQWSREQLLALLERVGLAAVAESPVGGFSAGMRKRLTILRLRLERPRLILLDEPFSALDPAGQRLLEEEIQEHLMSGATVMMASHAIARASRLPGRALCLDRGQVAWTGTTAELPELFSLAG